ncbi:MAG: hypothetical protein NVSMB51_00110 [Solirubrobacteraceae bacterium]
MLAITVYNTVLALHIAAVVVAFGVTFTYPLMYAVAMRLEPRSMPAIHRIQDHIGKKVITPGLVVVLAAGIYLAADSDVFSEFYVQWGFFTIIVLGALGGAYCAPRERRLVDLAQHDIDAAGSGEVEWGPEYLALRRQVRSVNVVANLLVLATILIMTAKPGS